MITPYARRVVKSKNKIHCYIQNYSYAFAQKYLTIIDKIMISKSTKVSNIVYHQKKTIILLKFKGNDDVITKYKKSMRYISIVNNRIMSGSKWTTGV